DRLAEIINYIHANYQKRLSLNELAENLYLSVPYLSKYIKRNMGTNFVEYVNNIRLFHAVDDLLYTDKSIMSVALDNGFANAAAFNELFKRIYSEKPSEYRHNMNTLEKNEEILDKGQENEEISRRINEYLENNMIASPIGTAKDEDFMVLDTNNAQEFKHFWNKMINVGRAGDLLRSDMQEHILILKEEIGFQYVRFWDIFSIDMLINESSEKGKYNFEKLDKVLDFLVEHDIKPYFELGYKPRNLHSTLVKRIVSENREIAFQSLESFKRFLSAFAVHLTNRYGLEEIEEWYFEQWSGEDLERGADNDYFFSVFNSLYEIMKKISPKIRVGGGGIGIQYGSGNLSRLVCTWGEQKHLPDFLSLYCYPYIKGDEDGIAYAKISTDKNFLSNQLEMASVVIANSKLRNAEIHVSEWSSTISNRNVLNDSCYKGAYIMKSIIDSIHRVDILGYWVGSDIFSEYYDSSTLLYGGCGLLSKDGIKKPSFYAYRFLNSMGKYLISADKNSIVTTNNNNSYYIACHNYRHLNYKYYLKSEDELEIDKLYQMYEDCQALQLNYQLSNVQNGRYKIKIYAISNENGSVQEEWRKMGLSNHLTKQEVEYLKRISTPYIQIKECEVRNNLLNFEALIQAQEIQYIHISYLYE
ncbi:MAG: helix-turn-helix domain-containing protein, partial [Mobilitalea sp.]